MALCATAQYVEGLDLTKLEVNLGDIALMLRRVATSKKIDVQNLVRLIGDEDDQALINGLISARPIDCTAIATKMADALAEYVTIPFAINPYTADGEKDPFPRAVMTEREWYGKWYAPRQHWVWAT